jgi:hypothetical protein
MTAGFSAQWEKKGLPANSVGDLARTIVEASTNPERKGHGILVSSLLHCFGEGVMRLITHTDRWKLCQGDRDGKSSAHEGVAR